MLLMPNHPLAATSRAGSRLFSPSSYPFGSGAVGDGGWQQQAGMFAQAPPLGQGICRATDAGLLATRIGVNDSILQQLLSTAGHLAQSGIDLQEADACPVNSDAPTNAVKATNRKRSLETVFGMMPFRTGLRIGVPIELDALS
jgi:hypothetical protein